MKGMMLRRPETFRALRHRNFRLFFYGQMLSLAGTWMQRVAQGWLVYRLTGSAFLLGVVTFASSAPAFFFSPLAGVVADRVNRHRMLIMAQALAMLQSLSLALVTLTGAVTSTQLIIFALMIGAINAFENPARQSFFVEMIDREDLTNAIALNASMVNAARVLGPAAAGLLVAAYGEGFCFLINGLSFLAVIAALLMMKLEGRTAPGPSRSQGELLREGLRFIQQSQPVRSLLSLFGVLNFAGTAYLTLLPIFAGSVLQAGPTGLGWLTAASGIGAVATAIMLASRSSNRGLPRLVLIAAVSFAAGLIILGLSHSFVLSLTVMLLIGGGYVVTLAATQILLQTGVPDDMRGRVMSFYSLIFLGFPPFGSLVAGWVAEKAGAPLAVSLGGIICLIAALWFARSEGAQPAFGQEGLGYSDWGA